MASLSLPTILALFLSIAVPCLSFEYGKVHHGDGTYYGSTEGGHCSIRQPRPNMYSGLQPVALNSAQYGDSLPCGACIEYQGSGRGSGANPIKGKRIGYVMDECPSCAPGDIDLSMSGDGRWDVSWKFVACPGSSFPVSFLLEGSNDFYKKVQPRGTRGPVRSMSINGIQGRRTVDNFFVFDSGFPASAEAVLSTMLGDTVKVAIPYWVSDGVVVGSGGRRSSRRGPPKKPSPPKKKPSSPKRTPKKPRRRPSRGRCVPRWRTCSGRRNKFRTSKCCGGWRCSWSKRKRGHGGKRCLPPKKRKRRRGGKGKCVPNWKPCTGRNNVWGTSNCCGRYKCRVPAESSFVGKRCEP